MTTNHQFIDISGQRFGRLVAIRRVENDRFGQARWLCKCQCGGERVTSGNTLRRGLTTSCGCKSTEASRDTFAVHGRSETPENKTWRNIRSRAKRLKLWIDPAWDTFEGFHADMGEKPSPRHRLRRSGLDDSYGPNNCYWAPPTKP